MPIQDAAALFIARSTLKGGTRSECCSYTPWYPSSVLCAPPMPVPIATPIASTSSSSSASFASASASAHAPNANWLTRSSMRSRAAGNRCSPTNTAGATMREPSRGLNDAGSRLMPESPARRRSKTSVGSLPSGEINPMPVTTTRLTAAPPATRSRRAARTRGDRYSARDHPAYRSARAHPAARGAR